MRLSPSFIAVDPGKTKCGVAYFNPGGVLLECALVERTDLPSDPAKAWCILAGNVVDEFASHRTPIDLVVERMQVDGRTGKAQAIAILDLNGVVGALAGFMRGRVTSYSPSQWNKNRKKEPNHTRILRKLADREKEIVLGMQRVKDGDRCDLLSSLRPKIMDADLLYQRAMDGRIGDAEHVMDAIGIGLFHAGRL